MAIITPTVEHLADGTAIKLTWTPLIIIDTDPGAPEVLEYDEGLPAEFCRFSDRSIQVVGTWGGGSPTKPQEQAVTLASTGGTITAIRQSDE